MLTLHHIPRARQHMLDYRDFVMDDVAIGFVDGDLLLDNGLVVFVRRNAAGLW